MDIKQIYTLTNTIVTEITGKSDLVAEDLSNVVDVGTEVFNATSYDNYVRSLVDHIGKVIFVNRTYTGTAPSVLMDGWEFGAVCEKIQAEMPEATENETWDLQDKQSYDPNVFYKPVVSAKFYSKRVTFEIPISITERQVKSSFSSASQLNSFLSMIYNAVDKALTVRISSLIMRTVNNMIGETLHSEYPESNYTTKSGVRAINLLKLYNDRFSPSPLLTADKAITDKDFIRFAVNTMSIYMDRIATMSTLFNIGNKERFTPRDMLHFIMLSDFASGAATYLQSDTFHDNYTALPNGDTVPYWQGSGTDYSFDKISSIHINTASGSDEVEASGILAVMFDRDALGVSNLSRRVTSNYNAKAEFWNNYYKFEAGYFNDTNENFVVFFVA